MSLANRKIKKKHLHSHDWITSDFCKMCKLLSSISTNLNKEMPLDIENEYQ
jgi:hypothetical protein